MVERKEGENEESSLLCSLVEYSYKNQFLMLSGVVCSRAAESLPICEAVRY